MRYYYKSKSKNSYLNYKSPLWRTDEERTKKEMNEEGEEITTLEDYTQDELDLQEQYTQITEQEFLDAQPKPIQPTAEQIALQEKQKEMAEIKQWLNEHDYIINKHLLGEYTDNDERWLNYLQERKIKLDRYNELEK